MLAADWSNPFLQTVSQAPLLGYQWKYLYLETALSVKGLIAKSTVVYSVNIEHTCTHDVIVMM